MTHNEQPLRMKQEISDFLFCLRRNKNAELDVFQFLIGINSGLRMSDIVKLQKKDVISSRNPRIVEQKTVKTRILYLSSLQELIQHYTKDLNPEDYLFPSTTGSHLKVNTVYQMFQKVTELLDWEMSNLIRKSEIIINQRGDDIMKKVWLHIKRKKFFYLVSLVFLMLIIPILVYLVALVIDIYKDFPMETSLDWESSLNYFGTVYGSLLGFVGVILTILYTQNQATKQKKEANEVRQVDNAISVMPYLHVEFVNGEDYYYRYKQNLRLIAKEGNDCDRQLNVSINITNKGGGAATQLYLFTRNEHNTENNQLLSHNKTNTVIIDVKEEKKLGLLINYYTESSDVDKDLFLEIEFEYKDIFFNKYKEKHVFYFRKNKNVLKADTTFLKSKYVYDPKGNPLPISINPDD